LATQISLGALAWLLPLSWLFTEGAGDYEVTEVKPDLQQLLNKLDKASEPEVWEIERELEGLGKEAAAFVKERLAGLSPLGRLAGAKMLCAVTRDAAGTEALLGLVEGEAPAALRVKAAELLSAYGLLSPAESVDRKWALVRADRILSLMRKAEEPLLAVALAKAVWVVGADEGQKTEAYGTLRRTLGSKSPEVRVAAAFAVAELSGLQPLDDEVKQVLAPFENEPTPRGRRATALLGLSRLVEYVVRDEGFDRRIGNPLIREVLERIQTYHVDEELTNPAYLVEAAAKGMAGRLDRFSSYMTRAEWKRFKEGMSGNYAGIGALVSEFEGKIFVQRAFYHGPAYKAGIRSLDQIVKLDDKDVAGKKLGAVVGLLRGGPGSAVKITVERRRAEKPLSFEMKREMIHVPAVEYDSLPGKIGYLKLTGFGDKAANETSAALEELEQKLGIRGLIFDLRGNPGGLISAAQKIANLFLSGDKLIVYSQGRNQQVAPRRDLRTLPGVRSREFPMVVLIDRDSASASEIVAGALQDHKRALLIGETTYGKGSVQQLMPVDATEKTSALRLTIAKYFLPSGRSIHEVGVKPDVRVRQPLGPSQSDARVRGLPATAFQDYFLDRKEQHRELLEDLALSDGGEYEQYPDFEAWYASLKTEAPKDAVRDRLRLVLRRLIADERGKEFVYDLVEDAQLQAGVREVAKRMGLDLSEHELFRELGEEMTPKEN